MHVKWWNILQTHAFLGTCQVCCAKDAGVTFSTGFKWAEHLKSKYGKGLRTHYGKKGL